MKSQRGKIVVLASLPSCDFCERTARADARTVFQGSWAYLCPMHWTEYARHRTFGVGKGQALALPDEEWEGPMNIIFESGMKGGTDD